MNVIIQNTNGNADESARQKKIASVMAVLWTFGRASQRLSTYEPEAFFVTAPAPAAKDLALAAPFDLCLDAVVEDARDHQQLRTRRGKNKRTGVTK